MNLTAWEATMRQIADEFRLAPSEAGQHRILTAARGKLAKEPTFSPPLRIDQIVREARRKITVASRRPNPVRKALLARLAADE